MEGPSRVLPRNKRTSEGIWTDGRYHAGQGEADCLGIGHTCCGGFCEATQLTSLRILANDFTVAGVTVKNAEIQTNRPASISSGDGIDFIENGNLVVDVIGSINGIAQHLLLTNQGAFSINTSLTSFNLTDRHCP